MNRPINSLKNITNWTLVTLLAGLLLTACSPQKTVSKYNYLLDKDGKTLASAENPGKKPAAQPSFSSPKGKGSSAKAGAIGSSALSRVVGEAESYLGTPYKYGGTTKGGIDCSALTQNAWSSAGVKLSRSSRDQAEQGKKVSMKELKKGDIAVFASHNDGKINHVGLIIETEKEGIQFIHATTSYGVRVDRLDEGYWKPRFMFGRRVSHLGNSIASN